MDYSQGFVPKLSHGTYAMPAHTDLHTHTTYRWEHHEIVGMGIAMWLKRIMVKEVAPIDVVFFQTSLHHSNFPTKLPIQQRH